MRKLKAQLGFVLEKKQLLWFSSRFDQFLNMQNVICMHAAARALLGITISGLEFNTGDSFRSHHSILYGEVGWTPP